MKKGILILLLFVATTVFAQNWVKDGNGIPERVAIMAICMRVVIS